MDVIELTILMKYEAQSNKNVDTDINNLIDTLHNEDVFITSNERVVHRYVSVEGK